MTPTNPPDHRDSELGPCPFCGAKPEKRLGVGEWWVSCPACESHSKGCSNYDAAVAAWNRRPLSAAPAPPVEPNAALVEALTKCRDRFNEYALLHYRKRTAEGDEKALSNAHMAEMCDAALRAAEASPPSEPQPMFTPHPFDEKGAHHGDPCIYCATAHDDVPPGPCMSHPRSLAETMRDYAMDVRDGFLVSPKASDPLSLKHQAAEDVKRADTFLDRTEHPTSPPSPSYEELVDALWPLVVVGCNHDYDDLHDETVIRFTFDDDDGETVIGEWFFRAFRHAASLVARAKEEKA